MTGREAQLMRAINGGSDSLDALKLGANGNIADQPFEATFDIQLLAYYFTDTSGTFANIAASALNAGLKSNLPFFLFGYGDYKAGYKALKGRFTPNANWTAGRPFVYGAESIADFGFDSTVLGYLETGDVVLPYTSALPGTGVTTLALLILRCPQVAMGTLLEYTSSDTFTIDGIRYVLDDTSVVAQYSNKIEAVDISIFGRTKADSYTPNSAKSPEQYQPGIVDLPIIKGIGKHNALAFFNRYDNVSSSMSIFVRSFDKLQARD